jgi:hypothetical protein
MVSRWSREESAARRIPGLQNALWIDTATCGEVPASYWPKLAKRLRHAVQGGPWRCRRGSRSFWPHVRRMRL